MHSLPHSTLRAFARRVVPPALPLLLALSPMALQAAAPQTDTPSAAPSPETRATADAAYQKGLNLAQAAQASGGAMDEAVKELTAAANLGHPFAITTLARMYRLGEGVPKDEAHADALIARIERVTDPAILMQAGLSYLPKNPNVQPAEQNVDKALGYLLRSAQQGYGPALGPLGFCFMAASPKQQDLVAAFQWLYLAASQGDENARMYLERLRPHLTNAQTAEAMQRLNALRARSEAGRAGAASPPASAAPAAPNP